MNAPNPIQRFLGLPRSTDSPFELLGLAPSSCDEQAVRSALARRLDRLAHHPEAMSHEADEVRLALHVAAAQLLDPVVREKLSASAPSSLASESTNQSVHMGFQELAKRVLARAGGWGKESQRWLSLLAHAHGLNQSQLHDELRLIVEGVHSPSVVQISAPVRDFRSVDRAPSNRTLYEEIHAPRRHPRPALSASAVWLIGSAMVLIVFAAAMTLRGALGHPTRSNERSATQERIPGKSTDGVSPVIQGQQSPVSKGAEESGEDVWLRSPEMVIRWLRLAQLELDHDPGEAAWRFEHAVTALASTWTVFSDVDRSRANDIVLSVLQRFAENSDNGQRALRAIMKPAKAALIQNEAATAESIRAAAWSAAMISMLASNPDIVNTVRSAARAMFGQIGALTPAQRGSFEEHTQAALPIIAQFLAGQTERRSTTALEGWIAWADIVDRIARTSSNATRGKSDRLILDAADRLLHSQAHPGAFPAARDAFELLVSRVPWSADTPQPASWGVLLGWFDELNIDTRDLAVATEWLVKQKISPRPDPDMTLSRSASLDGRSALRDRYAQLWGKGNKADTLGFATVWSRAVRQTLVRFQKRTPADRLARAAVMSRLSEAAALQWRGEALGARAIVVEPASPIHAALLQAVVSHGIVRSVNKGGDGQWAVRYLSLSRQDVENRSRLLVELGRHSSPLGPIDADVVVQTALRGASSDLRTRARKVVKRRASEAGVISAVLDAVSQAPKNRLTTTLIAEITGHHLPPPTDATWHAQVRTALIDRLLTLLGASDESSPLDRLSIELARSYAVRAVTQQAESGADSFGQEQLAFNANSAKKTSADSYSLLWKSWWEQAQVLAPNRRAPVSFDAILRHHRGRLQLADGPMQQFAATQVSIAEAMALVVSAERPSRASDIRLVIENMADQRREASTILDQIIAAERAMLQLWGIRFGLMLSEVDSPAVSLDTTNSDGNRS